MLSSKSLQVIKDGIDDSDGVFCTDDVVIRVGICAGTDGYRHDLIAPVPDEQVGHLHYRLRQPRRQGTP